MWNIESFLSADVCNDNLLKAIQTSGLLKVSLNSLVSSHTREKANGLTQPSLQWTHSSVA